jgi:pSer/pThr/pTyr-binding forkhead associated (FHA) protein
MISGHPMRAFVRYGRDAIEVVTTILVGRSSHCDIVLEDEVASREHCRIEREGDRVFLVDLESRNGATLNGKPARGRAELHHGDIVTIGATQLVLLRQHDVPASERASEARTRPEAKLGLTDEDVHGEFLRAARRALDQGDVAAAGANARSFLLAVRLVPLTGELLGDASALMLELAERTPDVYWLDRVIELYLSRRAAMSIELARAIAIASAITGAPGPILDDYLAVAEHITSFQPAAADELRALARKH